MNPSLTIAGSTSEWIASAAHLIITQAREAIQARGEYSLVLSGGSTPQPVYRALAENADQIDWERIFIFWGDERCVPPDHRDSNYLMAMETLLSRVPVQGQNIFRMLGEIDADAAAQDYQEMLAAFFHDKEKRFDTVLLGLGEDGHTASLFPGTKALKETERWAVANPHPYSDTTRLTLTYPAINSARQIIFLVSGENKAEVAAEVVQNPAGPPPYPAKRITGVENSPHWILNAKAGTKIN